MISDWQQGQHLVLIGKTGSGKSYLARRLLSLRTYKIGLFTKPDTIGWSQFGWKTISRASEIDPSKAKSFRLMPDWSSAGEQFLRACLLAWNDGSWCVYADEAYHLKELGLEDVLIKLLTQGRSKRISVVVGTQRPAWISKFAFSEPTHVFCGRLTLGADLKKIRDEFGGPFESAVKGLNRYEFAYLDQDTDRIEVGREEDALRILHAREGAGLEPAGVAR